jgi:glycosyltransferase involved in cell wall biosynthesis
VAGVEEYAVHRENCMVAMPNDVRTMVSNVKMLIQDYKLRDKIRENGLSTAKKFSWDLVTDELINCLSQLPPGNKGKAGRAS